VFSGKLASFLARFLFPRPAAYSTPPPHNLRYFFMPEVVGVAAFYPPNAIPPWAVPRIPYDFCLAVVKPRMMASFEQAR